MSRWEEKQLGEVCTVISGYAFKSNDFISHGIIPVIKIANIGNGFVNIENNTQYADEKFLTTLNEKYIVKNGDVLISLTGSHITQPNSMVGRTALYTKNITSLLNQRVGKILGRKNKGLEKFIYYNLRTQWIREYIGIIAHGAANQANISPKSIESIKTLIPPLPTQQKIADILSTYDNLIENNNRRIELFEKAAENLYKEWFIRFRFPNYKKTKFENGLPKGWKVVKLGDIVDIIDGDRGNNYPKQEEFYDEGYCLFLNTSNVTKTGFNFSNNNFITEEKDNKLRKGKLQRNDIIMTTRGTIGNVALYSEFIKYHNIRINSGMVIIREKVKDIPIDFLYALLRSENMKKSIMLYSSGSAQPQLPIKDMRKLKLSLPSSNLIDQYNEKIKSINMLISNLQTQTQNLIKQRDMLLPRLMSGKLEI